MMMLIIVSIIGFFTIGMIMIGYHIGLASAISDDDILSCDDNNCKSKLNKAIASEETEDSNITHRHHSLIIFPSPPQLT